MKETDIPELLRQNDFRFNKRFGQNFITDTNLLSAIVCDAEVSESDAVLEIGAGAGTLTAALAEKAKAVVGYEIDENLRPILAKTLSGYPNARIVYGDVMNFSLDEIHAEIFGSDGSTAEKNKKYKLAANLPYYITTPILFKFLYDPALVSATVMVQKEVAQRMAALPGTPAYGALSAQLAVMGEVKLARNVSRKLFRPEPEVDSAVVRLTLSPKCAEDLLPAVRRVIAAAFAMRRKTLLNNLSAAFALKKDAAESALHKAGIAPSVRGETLGVAEFMRLAETMRQEELL